MKIAGKLYQLHPATLDRVQYLEELEDAINDPGGSHPETGADECAAKGDRGGEARAENEHFRGIARPETGGNEIRPMVPGHVGDKNDQHRNATEKIQAGIADAARGILGSFGMLPPTGRMMLAALHLNAHPSICVSAYELPMAAARNKPGQAAKNIHTLSTVFAGKPQ